MEIFFWRRKRALYRVCVGIPYTVITPLIFPFVRAGVHDALFEVEHCLKSQMEVYKQGGALFVDKYKANQA